MFRNIVVLVFAVLLEACGQAIPVVDQAAVAVNNDQLKRCVADTKACEGAFIKAPPDGILMVTRGDGSNAFRRIDIERIVGKMVEPKQPTLPTQVEWVVLPSDPAWDQVAIAYARQFVKPHDFPKQK